MKQDASFYMYFGRQTALSEAKISLVEKNLGLIEDKNEKFSLLWVKLFISLKVLKESLRESFFLKK